MSQPIVSNFVRQPISENQTIIHHPSDRLSWQVKAYKRPRNGKTEKLECIYVGSEIHEYFNFVDFRKKFGGKLKNRYSKVCGTTYEVVIKNATWEQLDDLLLAEETRQSLWGAALRDPSYGLKEDWAGLEEFTATYTPRKQKPAYDLELLQSDNIFEIYSVIVGGEPLTQVTYHKIFQGWGWQFSSFPLEKDACIRQAIAHANKEKALCEKYRLKLTSEGGFGYELN
jgi:hypothetical protein